LNASHSPQPALLLLQDGTIFKGKAIGNIGTTTGEICFNTGMTGYQEIFTDPSYFGQVMVMANTHIGNYGELDADMESNDAKISGWFAKVLVMFFREKEALILCMIFF